MMRGQLAQKAQAEMLLFAQRQPTDLSERLKQRSRRVGRALRPRAAPRAQAAAAQSSPLRDHWQAGQSAQNWKAPTARWLARAQQPAQRYRPSQA